MDTVCLKNVERLDLVCLGRNADPCSCHPDTVEKVKGLLSKSEFETPVFTQLAANAKHKINIIVQLTQPVSA